jgi:hypothetical protein
MISSNGFGRSGCDVSDVQSRQIFRGTEESAKTYIRTGHLLIAVIGHTTRSAATIRTAYKYLTNIRRSFVRKTSAQSIKRRTFFFSRNIRLWRGMMPELPLMLISKDLT